MKITTTKIWGFVLVIFTTLSLISCGSDEPQWADPEAHEKTEQLRKQYSPLILGTWHYEGILDTQRAFEQLTFNADGTLNGQRKWQLRKIVTIDGQEHYTDWEDIPNQNGAFTGTWSLAWERNQSGTGENRITLIGNWDDKDNHFAVFSYIPLFGYADETTLQFAGYWQNKDGWTIYERGASEPSF